MHVSVARHARRRALFSDSPTYDAVFILPAQYGHLACLRISPEDNEPMGEERRNIVERAAVVRQVINSIVQNPSVTLSVNTLQAWLGVPMEAAQRILQRLASSGLIREVQRGVWARGTWPGAQREWY
jgi:hypothetical protein